MTITGCCHHNQDTDCACADKHEHPEDSQEFSAVYVLPYPTPRLP